jgi:hypothetical protein
VLGKAGLQKWVSERVRERERDRKKEKWKDRMKCKNYAIKIYPSCKKPKVLCIVVCFQRQWHRKNFPFIWRRI